MNRYSGVLYRVDKFCLTIDIVLESISACSVHCKLLPWVYNSTKKEEATSLADESL